MNRLARERSPYLLQHAANPVDWFPWGDEAFERARREDKPIFLSIGYSTCHWCHVMEHESFENPAIAELLNRDFVSIKVDREERPDVDRVYMTFVQATTGSGGWPMSVWLTPELKPFYGGTYFPPSSRWGRPGFTDLLGELARVWKAERPKVEEAATELLQRLRSVTGAAGAARAESEIAPARARYGGRAVPGVVRSPPRRVRRCAEVSPPLGAAVSSARARAAVCCGGGARGAAADGDRDAARDGARRHARSRRRRLPPLLGRRRLARAAFREDAVRPGAARARRTSKPPRRPARSSTPRSPKTRSRTSAAT